MGFRKLLKEKVTEIPTDSLAHILDIPYELAQLIQVTLEGEVTDYELEASEKLYNERVGEQDEE